MQRISYLLLRKVTDRFGTEEERRNGGWARLGTDVFQLLLDGSRWVGLSCFHQLIPQLKMLNAADPADQDGQKVKAQLKRFFAAARVNPLWSPPLLPVADAVFIDILSGLMGPGGISPRISDIH